MLVNEGEKKTACNCICGLCHEALENMLFLFGTNIANTSILHYTLNSFTLPRLTFGHFMNVIHKASVHLRNINEDIKKKTQSVVSINLKVHTTKTFNPHCFSSIKQAYVYIFNGLYVCLSISVIKSLN